MSIDQIVTINLRHNGGYYFVDRDRFHAAEINRAFPQETWTAFDVVPQNGVIVAKRARQTRFSGPENGNRRNAQQSRQMHGASVVSQKQLAGS